LRLYAVGPVRSSPQQLIAQGTDWRLLTEREKALKAARCDRPRAGPRRARPPGLASRADRGAGRAAGFTPGPV